MKQIFIILLWCIFFNISVIMVSATGFFPSVRVFYGDAFTTEVYSGLNSNHVPTATVIIDNLMRGPSITILDFTFELSFMWIMTGVLAGSFLSSIITKSTVPITLGILGTAFLNMWANSNSLIDHLMSDFSSVGVYFFLMIGIGVTILFIMEVYDVTSGQRSS